MFQHVGFKTNLQIFSRACYGISNIWSHANLYTMIDFALFVSIHPHIFTNWIHTLHCLLADHAFLTFFGHFVNRVCSEIPPLNNGHVAEKVWALSELILMCNTSVITLVQHCEARPDWRVTWSASMESIVARDPNLRALWAMVTPI